MNFTKIIVGVLLLTSSQSFAQVDFVLNKRTHRLSANMENTIRESISTNCPAFDAHIGKEIFTRTGNEGDDHVRYPIHYYTVIEYRISGGFDTDGYHPLPEQQRKLMVGTTVQADGSFAVHYYKDSQCF
ncbi:MAG: hypothetical protein V4596_03140 [Bdellovibrionota bacterium]